MRYQGEITKWLDDKGYGFITSDNGERVFAHISAFKQRGGRPVIGEIVTYEVASDARKGLQAYNILYLNQSTPATHRHYATSRRRNNYSLVSIVLVLLVAYVLWSKYKHVDISNSPQALTPTQVFNEAPLQSFECSGKTLCSQMTSCEEAVFYLKNCAGSVTDGDNDGLPCEDQWCGH